MPEKSQKRMAEEVHQGMFGVEGTDDRGLVGDVKEIKSTVKEQNKRVTKVEGKVKQIYGMIIGAALAGGGIGAGIGQLLGG